MNFATSRGSVSTDHSITTQRIGFCFHRLLLQGRNGHCIYYTSIIALLDLRVFDSIQQYKKNEPFGPGSYYHEFFTPSVDPPFVSHPSYQATSPFCFTKSFPNPLYPPPNPKVGIVAHAQRSALYDISLHRSSFSLTAGFHFDSDGS